MNPNPEQPDAPSRLAVKATRALQNENGRRLLAGEEFLTQDEIALLIDRETGLGNLSKLEAAGWDAARVFERLPEVLNGSHELVRGIEGTGLADQFAPSNTPKNRFIALLAQLKLKRDTAGGGR